MRALVTVLLLCAAIRAQGTLDADLKRAADRFGTAAIAPPSEAERYAAEAGDHLRDGRTAEAVAALDRAAGSAYRAGATGRAFELSLTAAEAQRSAGEVLDAARRYRDAALALPGDRRAAAAHHLACQTLATTLDGADTARLDEYEGWLAQHLATWPNAPSAEAVRWAQIELLARRARWTELLPRARAVAKNDPNRARAERLLVAAHEGLLSSESTPQAFEAARADLQPLFVHAPTPWPAQWTTTQREAAYTLARVAVGQGAEGAEYARTLLTISLDGQPAPTGDWKHRAGALLTVCLLGQGDFGAAAEAFARLHSGSPDERQRLLIALHRRLSEAGGAASLPREADRLAESVAALTSPASSDKPSQARAFVDAGRDAEARRLYKRLAAERPNDREVQTEYARLLQRSDLVADGEEAVRRWRAIESRSPRGSDDWFAARLGRLESLTASGQTEDARKLLKLTRLLAPSLSGEAMRSKFEAVAKSLE